jgi:sigma-B regulation protein RsbU (phosphoserine phosphatase)
MADLTSSLFGNYNRIMRVTFCGVLLVATALIYLQYRQTLQAETDMLSQRMQEQAVALDAILKSSSDAVNTLRIQAQAWYSTHPLPDPSSPLLSALEDPEQPGRLRLDRAPPPWNKSQIGNLTGFVDQPSISFTKELQMALGLNTAFQAITANIPEATWVYYTSARRFINIYPWIASDEFFYADSLHEKDFFRGVEPQRDPQQKIIWTPAYLDEAGQGVMVTASAGVYEGATFRGAVSLDLTLERLNAFVSDWQSRFGTLFIVNDHGQLLAHPNLVRADAKEVLPSAAAFPETLAGKAQGILDAAVGKLIVRDGFYVETRAIHNAPLRLVLLVPERELMESALRSGVLMALALVAGLTLMLLVASRWTHREAIAPAQKLVRYIQDENRGSAKSIPDIPAAWLPWFQTIQNVFNAHTQLVSIQQELDVARRMQQAIVPTRFPHLAELQMFARMIPAKEVGGDFYDYFWLGEGKIGMVIADVSGKGVPAALFMAVARTLLRATAPAASGPGSCLAMANDLLAQDNEATMFVTLFYGILDTRSGELEYANGGHNPPFLIAPDGRVSTLPGTDGMALGIMEGLPYAEKRIVLEPGSTLLLYTDGVTEAFNPSDEEYGERRLAELLAHAAELPVEPLLEQIVGQVHVFADGAPQSDDITCLAVHYAAPAST